MESGFATNAKGIFAAIYVRTSSPNQRYNYSIGEQINECWNYCVQRNWIVRYVFADECELANTTDRPKFQLMIHAAERREFGVVCAWKLDRLCRSLVDMLNLERTLRGWEVEICSITEFIDTTTSVGRFNFRSIASVAELEREQIGERARLGMYGLAKEKRWPNPHPPLGYSKDRDGRLTANSVETVLVGRIFNAYLDMKSTSEVAFRLNQEGVQTRKGKWSATAIRDILTNKIYIGRYRVAGFEVQAEEYRIVSDELFTKAGGMLERYQTPAASFRPAMPHDRKLAAIQKIHGNYIEFLDTVRFNPHLPRGRNVDEP